MYRVFRKIPAHMRQLAFDRLLAGGYGQWLDKEGGLCRTKATNRYGLMTCPLGMVNTTFSTMPANVKVGYFAATGNPRYVPTRMPENGEDEHAILELVNIDIDPEDAQCFIDDNDNYQFNSPAKLATAMGVEYHQENENV